MWHYANILKKFKHKEGLKQVRKSHFQAKIMCKVLFFSDEACQKCLSYVIIIVWHYANIILKKFKHEEGLHV